MRDTGKRPANVMVCENLLLAFYKLDSAALVEQINERIYNLYGDTVDKSTKL